MRKKVGTLSTPEELKEKYPLNENALNLRKKSTQELKDIHSGKSDKKSLIIGPCSADFEETLYEYADFLQDIQEKVKDKILIIMRFYTGKPRTIGGWKGLQNSSPGEKPDLVKGLDDIRRIGTSLINEHNIPLADELLHPQFVEYLEDIYTYHAVGARSTENQKHREVSSGLEFPVGFKNSTSGEIKCMVNSILAGKQASTYVIGREVFETDGNEYSHGILRGGENGPNYSRKDLEEVDEIFKSKGIETGVVVDTNHGNSNKQYERQIEIMDNVMDSIEKNPELGKLVKGFMTESYLFDGRQDFSDDIIKGKSLTDPCIGKEKTEEFILRLYERLKKQ